MTATLHDLAASVPAILIDFGKALDDAGALLPDGWAYFLQKPWKWSQEYGYWVAAGFPQEGDGEAWDKFCDFIEEHA